jgi:hypothetical protein
MPVEVINLSIHRAGLILRLGQDVPSGASQEAPEDSLNHGVSLSTYPSNFCRPNDIDVSDPKVQKELQLVFSKLEREVTNTPRGVHNTMQWLPFMITAKAVQSFEYFRTRILFSIKFLTSLEDLASNVSLCLSTFASAFSDDSCQVFFQFAVDHIDAIHFLCGDFDPKEYIDEEYAQSSLLDLTEEERLALRKQVWKGFRKGLKSGKMVFDYTLFDHHLGPGLDLIYMNTFGSAGRNKPKGATPIDCLGSCVKDKANTYEEMWKTYQTQVEGLLADVTSQLCTGGDTPSVTSALLLRWKWLVKGGLHIGPFALNNSCILVLVPSFFIHMTKTFQDIFDPLREVSLHYRLLESDASSDISRSPAACHDSSGQSARGQRTCSKENAALSLESYMQHAGPTF